MSVKAIEKIDHVGVAKLELCYNISLTRGQQSRKRACEWLLRVIIIWAMRRAALNPFKDRPS